MEKRADPRNRIGGGKAASPIAISGGGKQQRQQIAGLYDLEETIGEGHYAVVKLARHVFTGEKVRILCWTIQGDTSDWQNLPLTKDLGRSAILLPDSR